MSRAILAAATYGNPPEPQFLGVADGNRLVSLLRHDRRTGTIAQLIAASSGEGTSSLVRDLALVAARLPGMRVLLLDLDPPGNTQIAALCGGFGVTIVASRPLMAPGDVLVHQLADVNLCVSETRRAPGAGLAGWVDVFAALRSDFELVLIDSPPIERSYDGIMLSLGVDTNLLVVEAERTRSAVARNLRDCILAMGGPIGGVVINKRRIHIPAFIGRYV